MKSLKTITIMLFSVGIIGTVEFYGFAQWYRENPWLAIVFMLIGITGILMLWEDV